MPNSSSNHFTCPKGGDWYACPNEPRFIGCCSEDPCTTDHPDSDSPCPQIYPASYNTSFFDKIEPNTCIGDLSSSFYSCAWTDPSFVGCCSSNPCVTSTGCPTDNLTAAKWTTYNPGQLALFQDKGSDEEDGLSGGAIAGIVVGAVAALVIIGGLVWFFIRRRNKKSKHALSITKNSGPISELASGQSYGVGVHGAQNREPTQELDSKAAVHELDTSAAEVHELDGLGPNRPQ